MPEYLWVFFPSDFPTKTLMRRVPKSYEKVPINEFDFVKFFMEHTATESITALLGFMVRACVGTESEFNETAKTEIERHWFYAFANDYHKGMHTHRFTLLPLERFAFLFNAMRTDDQTGKVAMEWRQTNTKSKKSKIDAFASGADSTSRDSISQRPQFEIDHSPQKGKQKYTAAYIFFPLVHTATYSNPNVPVILPFDSTAKTLIKHLCRYQTATTSNDKRIKSGLKKASSSLSSGADDKKKKNKKTPKSKAESKSKKKKTSILVEESNDESDADESHDMSESEDNDGDNDDIDVAAAADGDGDNHKLTASFWDEHRVTPARLAYCNYVAFRNGGVCAFPPAAMLADDPTTRHIFRDGLHNPAALGNTTCKSLVRLNALSSMSVPSVDTDDVLTTNNGTWTGTLSKGMTAPKIKRGKLDNPVLLAVISFCKNTDAAHLVFDERPSSLVHYNDDLRDFLTSDACIGELNSSDFFKAENAFAAIGMSRPAAMHSIFVAVRDGCFESHSTHKITAKVFFRAYLTVLHARMVFVNEEDVIAAAFAIFAEYFLELCPNKQDLDEQQVEQVGLCIMNLMRLGERIFWAWLVSYIDKHCPSSISMMHARYTTTWDGTSELVIPESKDHANERDGVLALFSPEAIALFFKTNFKLETTGKVKATGQMAEEIRTLAVATTMKFRATGPVYTDTQDIVKKALESLGSCIRLTVNHTMLGGAEGKFVSDDLSYIDAVMSMVAMFNVFALTPVAMLMQEWHHHHGSVIKYTSHSGTQHPVEWTAVAAANPAGPTLAVIKAIAAMSHEMVKDRAKLYNDNTTMAFDSLLSDLQNSSSRLPVETKAVMTLAYNLIEKPNGFHQGYFIRRIADLPSFYSRYVDSNISDVQALVAENMIQVLPLMARGTVNVSAKAIEEYLLTQAAQLFQDPHRPRDLENGTTPEMCLARMFAILPQLALESKKSTAVGDAIKLVTETPHWPDHIPPSTWIAHLRLAYRQHMQQVAPVPVPAVSHSQPSIQLAVMPPASTPPPVMNGHKRAHPKDEKDGSSSSQQPAEKKAKIEPVAERDPTARVHTSQRIVEDPILDLIEVDYDDTPILTAAEEKAKADADEEAKAKAKSKAVVEPLIDITTMDTTEDDDDAKIHKKPKKKTKKSKTPSPKKKTLIPATRPPLQKDRLALKRKQEEEEKEQRRLDEIERTRLALETKLRLEREEKKLAELAAAKKLKDEADAALARERKRKEEEAALALRMKKLEDEQAELAAAKKLKDEADAKAKADAAAVAKKLKEEAEALERERKRKEEEAIAEAVRIAEVKRVADEQKALREREIERLAADEAKRIADEVDADRKKKAAVAETAKRSPVNGLFSKMGRKSIAPSAAVKEAKADVIPKESTDFWN